MIDHAWAVRFDRQAKAGRNCPLVVGVEAPDGSDQEVFLKISSCETGVEGLANEALAACIAAESLGLPVPQPYFVHWERDFIDALPNDDLRDRFHRSVDIGFGSRAVTGGWRPWSREDRMTLGRLPMAERIFVFDALICNDDRRPENSNCLLRGDEFRIIDHELAFRIRSRIPRPRPWQVGQLQHMRQFAEHAFFRGLLARISQTAV